MEEEFLERLINEDEEGDDSDICSECGMPIDECDCDDDIDSDFEL